MMNRLQQIILREASTRSVSLLRLLLVFILWSRFASDVLPFRSFHADRWALSFAFFFTTAWMFVGYYARLATLATGMVLMVMVMHYGPTTVEPWSHHHTTILALGTLLLAFTPCGGSYSADRWLSVSAALKNKEPIPLEIGPSWGRILIGLLVGAVYFWSGLDKLSYAFWSGERMEQILMYLYLGSDFPTVPGFHLLMSLSAKFVTVVWLIMPVALFHPKLQKVFLPLGLFLHTVIYIAFPVATFTVTMWSYYLVFLDPDAVHRFIDRMQGVVQEPG